MNARKNLLKNAKLAMQEEFNKNVFAVQEKIKEQQQEENPNEVLIAQLIEEESKLNEEYYSRRSHNKKAKVQRTCERENSQIKKVDYTALNEYRASAKKQKTQQVGPDWLYEGALVTLRNKTTVMIITQIHNDQAEVFVDGHSRFFRTKSLRPADWLNEEE